MFRFKLITLLIATVLVGLFLALQVHVYVKTRRFLEEKLAKSAFVRNEVTFEIDDVSMDAMSISDFFMLKRSCQVILIGPTNLDVQKTELLRHHYHVPCIGAPERTSVSNYVRHFE